MNISLGVIDIGERMTGRTTRLIDAAATLLLGPGAPFVLLYTADGDTKRVTSLLISRLRASRAVVAPSRAAPPQYVVRRGLDQDRVPSFAVRPLPQADILRVSEQPIVLIDHFAAECALQRIEDYVTQLDRHTVR